MFKKCCALFVIMMFPPVLLLCQFLPDGAGRARDMRRPLVRVVEGALRSCVTVEASWVRHSACLHNSPGTDGAAIAIQVFSAAT